MLHGLNAGDVLIEVCGQLPELAKYVAQWDEAAAGEGTRVSTSVTEAVAHKATFKVLSEDISMASKALSLPLLEPLTSERLVNVTKLVMGCLVASVSVATTQSILAHSSSDKTVARQISGKEEENQEACAVEITEMSLELFNSILSTIRQSTRAGGHILQNFTTMGTWVLTTGLLIQLTNTTHDKQSGEDKSGGDFNGRISLSKAQQGFGVLSVALGSQALTLIALLLDDLSSETRGDAGNDDKIEAATFDLMYPFKASQRVALILNSVPFIPLLFNVAIISYNKAIYLRKNLRQTEEKEEDASFPEHDVNVVDEDDEDDDSEPLLGKWFEETLFPPEEKHDASLVERSDSDDKIPSGYMYDGCGGILVPSKGEPAGFISLASHVLIFMNKHLLTTESNFIKNYVQSGLTELQMSVLAAMVIDMDIETYKHSFEFKSSSNSALSALYLEFSSAMATFNHNLLSFNLLTPKLQNTLLSQLGVSPWDFNDDPDAVDAWPLTVYPRTLSLLAQMLLLRQVSPPEEQSLYSPRHTNTYIVIWERVLSTLTNKILFPDKENVEDLNVEHAQLLLFLFHALALMQKKQILLYNANCIIKIRNVVNSTDNLSIGQIFHVTRLVQLFEYMMRNLYEPPKQLLEQVQSNIFKRHLQNSGSFGAPLKFYPFRAANANKVEHVPKYFNLFSPPEIASTGQEVPKLDGLACSFVLGTPDSLNYDNLYQALIDLLQVVESYADTKAEKNRAMEAMFATQYCFELTWRMVQSLPPSVAFLECLSDDKEMHICSMLHSLILCPRLGNKVFGAWIKDALVKQGQTTARAESLLKSVDSDVNNFASDVKFMQRLMEKMKNKKFLSAKSMEFVSSNDMPSFFDLVTLDAFIAKVQISVDRMFAGVDSVTVKPGQTEREAAAANALERLKGVQDQLVDAVDATLDLVPMVLQLVKAFCACSRSTVLQMMGPEDREALATEDATKNALAMIMAIAGSKCSPTQELARKLGTMLPSSLKQALNTWNEGSITDFPQISSWRNNLGSENTLPSETYISAVIQAHLTTITEQSSFSPVKSLKHCFFSAASFAVDLFFWYPESSTLHCDLNDVFFPLIMDACTENLYEVVNRTLERIVGTQDGETFQRKSTIHVVSCTFETLLQHENILRNYVSENVLKTFVVFMTDQLDSKVGISALKQYVQNSSFSFSQLMFSISSPKVSKDYSIKVMTFLNKVFEAAEKSPDDTSCRRLCDSIVEVADVQYPELFDWLEYLVLGKFIFYFAS